MMNKLTIPAAITIAFTFLSGCGEQPVEKPNIILIIADDMAWDDCGAYGHPSVRTPHLDRLASEGIRFTSAFVTISSCSPSRASIITGRYPHHTGAEQLHWPVPGNQVTFVELLGKAGYWTAAAGKWHLGDALKDRFDRVVEPGMDGFVLPDSITGKSASMVAVNKSGCEDWIKVLNQRSPQQPFFLWLASFDPHRDYEDSILARPHTVNDVRVPPYLPDTPEVRKDIALYYDEITRLDSFIGLVLDELDRQGLAENTFVLFLSDNGRPFPRDKTTLYDGGIKTPFIVRWPRKIKPARVCANLLSSVDIAPTVLELAGIPVPALMEGTSFLPMLEQPEIPIREYIYAEDHWHDYEDLTRAVRSLRYKYIRNDYFDLPATPSADAGRSPTFQAMIRMNDQGLLTPEQQACFIQPRPKEELYDVLADPHELINLADSVSYKSILTEFRVALDDWSERTGFRIPLVRTPDEFDRLTGQPSPARIRPRPGKQWFIEQYGIE
jgi:N-sulfoglucosamine sulfohydrolase